MSRLAALQVLQEPVLSAQERAEYDRECAQVSAPRVTVMAVVLLVIAVVSVPVYVKKLGQPPLLYAELVLLFQALGAVFSVVALGAAALRKARHQEPKQWHIDAAAVAIITYAALISFNGIRLSGSMTAWPGAMLLISVLLRVRRAVALVLFWGAGGLLSVGVLVMQGPTTLGVTWAMMALAVAAIAWVSNRTVSVSLARDVQQRHIIAWQQQTLEALNRDLESRVEAQVAEIRARATEIERLNEHLRQQVKDRTEALRRALEDAARSHVVMPPGTLFENRIEVGALLGQGGMGTVYRGHDRTLGRAVALKLLSGRTNEPAALRRFLDEVAAAANVKHPGVVVPLHVDVTRAGDVYQVLELVEGLELSRVTLPLPVASVARIGAHIADALAVAHQAGVVHRDIKASNVMLTGTAPGVRLLDFGIAKLQHRAEHLTGEGDVVGTPNGMAPEQIEAPQTAGSPVDVYALGVLLFELAAGRSPFARESMSQTIIAHLKDPAPPLNVHPALDALVATCLEKAPAARPTAHAAHLALTQLADALGAAEAWRLELQPVAAVTEALGKTLDLPPTSPSNA